MPTRSTAGRRSGAAPRCPGGRPAGRRPATIARASLDSRRLGTVGASGANRIGTGDSSCSSVSTSTSVRLASCISNRSSGILSNLRRSALLAERSAARSAVARAALLAWWATTDAPEPSVSRPVRTPRPAVLATDPVAPAATDAALVAAATAPERRRPEPASETSPATPEPLAAGPGCASCPLPGADRSVLTGRAGPAGGRPAPRGGPLRAAGRLIATPPVAGSRGSGLVRATTVRAAATEPGASRPRPGPPPGKSWSATSAGERGPPSPARAAVTSTSMSYGTPAAISEGAATPDTSRGAASRPESEPGSGHRPVKPAYSKPARATASAREASSAGRSSSPSRAASVARPLTLTVPSGSTRTSRGVRTA